MIAAQNRKKVYNINKGEKFDCEFLTTTFMCQNNGLCKNSDLPLVLDGPFSSLSNENTNLIARKLPEFAEQVIIFMLDKDWEASGLDAYTLPQYCYRVNKEEKSNSSSLEQGGNW